MIKNLYLLWIINKNTQSRKICVLFVIFWVNMDLLI